MRFYIKGELERQIEFEQKFIENSEVLIQKSHWDSTTDAIFDLSFDDHQERIEDYLNLDIPIFLSTVKTTLATVYERCQGRNKDNIIGMNAIPGFINRSLWELASINNFLPIAVKDLLENNNIEYKLIADRVGMVSPRILFMIINEAYYTVQEGTATKEDVDLGMKLGTNYPYGPFEWANKIGVKNIYQSLEAIYEDTKDERYKICPLLKREYQMRNQEII